MEGRRAPISLSYNNGRTPRKGGRVFSLSEVLEEDQVSVPRKRGLPVSNSEDESETT